MANAWIASLSQSQKLPKFVAPIVTSPLEVDGTLLSVTYVPKLWMAHAMGRAGSQCVSFGVVIAQYAGVATSQVHETYHSFPLVTLQLDNYKNKRELAVSSRCAIGVTD